MTSAAFSMPDGHQGRVSIRRRSANTATATSSAADAALQDVLDRRLRKREGRLPPPRREAAIGGVNAGVPSANRVGGPQWLFRVGVLGFVAAVLGGGVWTLAASGSTSHTVAGRLLVGKTPLPHATISFHRAGGGGTGEAVSLTTGPDGSFQSPVEQPLPAGLYAVVVDGVRAGKTGRAAHVPSPYRDRETTPLRVLVTENLSGLQLLVRR
jgi:hypothetical protein